MKRGAVILAFIYFITMGIAVTFPGIAPFNTIRPLVLGIPFVFAWVLSWVAGSVLIFFVLYRAYHK
jgi:hypothetical protein